MCVKIVVFVMGIKTPHRYVKDARQGLWPQTFHIVVPPGSLTQLSMMEAVNPLDYNVAWRRV